MEQFLYERPREKLHSRGARFLTIVELLQVIIGAGGPQASGAKLARRISQTLQQNNLTPDNTQALFEELLGVHGVGLAKACQVFAAIELGRRLYVNTPPASVRLARSEGSVSHASLVTSARDGPTGLLCVWLDGSLCEISRKRYTNTASEHVSVLIRRIFSDALSVSAHAVVLAYYVKRPSLTPQITDLAMLKTIKDTASVLNVKVMVILAVSKREHQVWSNEI